MDKWLILDRDGVINYDSDQFIKSPEEWRPLPGSLEAIAALNTAGYRIAVISNQSGLARGLFDLDTLEAIHQKLHSQLAKQGGQIERIYFCPHGPDDHCSCRKPLPDMFMKFAEDFDAPLENIYAVGDSIRDLEAALYAGARSVLVRTGKGEKSEQSLRALPEDNPLSKVPVYNDLASFAEHILSRDINS
jgi:D-glycero-D-manno-heptose 1,7-bisphosphate phosphatase